MKTIEARELLTADRGIEIVLPSPLEGLTYVGWFQGAAGFTHVPSGDPRKPRKKATVVVALEDVSETKVTVVVDAEWQVHVTPFDPLVVGDVVARRGYSDPQSPLYQTGTFGTVVGVARDTQGNRVYSVEWPGEPAPRWHTRRKLENVGSITVSVDRVDL